MWTRSKNFWRVLLLLSTVANMLCKKGNKTLFKHILLWPESTVMLSYFGKGREKFIEDKCKFNLCTVTINKFMFKDNMQRFDAILFDGWNYVWKDLPKKRYPHQKWAYVNMESAVYRVVCNRKFDNFFNWTITYRLDSDICVPYLHVKDVEGKIIGPNKGGTDWITGKVKNETWLSKTLATKTKAAAWFVSRCGMEHRNYYIEQLTKFLKKFRLSVDIYGKCGPLKCPKNESDRCGEMLAKDYYFYLAFENSFTEDYISGKVYRALANNVVPIVYGGADYTKYLPPGSYIDAELYSAYELADLISHLVNNLKRYSQFFSWKYYYSFCSADPTEPTNRTDCNTLGCCRLLCIWHPACDFPGV